eukprot:1160781-Pelagomonas_calceolata.AAC.26
MRQKTRSGCTQEHVTRGRKTQAQDRRSMSAKAETRAQHKRSMPHKAKIIIELCAQHKRSISVKAETQAEQDGKGVGQLRSLDCNNCNLHVHSATCMWGSSEALTATTARALCEKAPANTDDWTQMHRLLVSVNLTAWT